MPVKINETIYPRGNYTEEQPDGGYRFRLPTHIKQYLKDTKENKMIGSIENQIAVHCDEPESLSASELLSIMVKGIEVLINGDYWNMADITGLLIGHELRLAAEESLTDNKSAINELYIKQINEMMEY